MAQQQQQQFRAMVEFTNYEFMNYEFMEIILWISLEKGECFNLSHSLRCLPYRI